jgi:hypothetical protein
VRFGILGSVFQIEPPSEGYALWQAGLFDKRGDPWQVEIQPSDLLRSLFTTMPELEELYPVLVEFVMSYRYPGILALADPHATARRLVSIGMTAEGLDTLRQRLENAARLI